MVEERPVARPKTEAPRPSAGHEETISAEAAIDLDTADPLAEADFHMAYGLYDQAVDLVRMALTKEPAAQRPQAEARGDPFRRGRSRTSSCTVARDLKRHARAPAGDWDRIVIMGRQLAPDEPMFAGGVQDAGVDLSLEGGDNLVDLDLLSTPEGDEGLDLDLGTVAAASAEAEATGENAVARIRPRRRLDVLQHDPGDQRARRWRHGRNADPRDSLVRDADGRDPGAQGRGRPRATACSRRRTSPPPRWRSTISASTSATSTTCRTSTTPPRSRPACTTKITQIAQRSDREHERTAVLERDDDGTALMPARDDSATAVHPGKSTSARSTSTWGRSDVPDAPRRRAIR